MSSIYTPAITSAGIGSGLDVNGLVNSLMNAESVPMTALNQQKTSSQAKISAFGTIKNTLAQFQTTLNKLSDPQSIQTISASSSNSSAVTVSSNGNAVPGNYTIQIKQLAHSQSLAANGQSSQDTAIGTGQISFNFGSISGGSFSNGQYAGANFESNGQSGKTVTIDSSHNSLSGIRDAINAANIGITASIIHDGSTAPYRLVLKNTQSGADQSLKISVSGDPALASLLNYDPAGNQNLTETGKAQDAQLNLDGLSIVKSSNTINDLIPGITLNLQQADANNTTQISVNRDTQALTNNLKDFVNSYNQLTNSLKSMSSYDMTNKKGAVLYGDASVRSMLSQIRSTITSALPSFAGKLSRLNQAGIEFQKDGSLTLDTIKLGDTIANHFDDLASLFANTATTTHGNLQFLNDGTHTQPGSYAINITHHATQGSLTGISSVSNISPLILDSTNNIFSVNLDGTTANISLPTGTYTNINAIASAMQAAINSTKAFSDNHSSVSFNLNGNTLSFISNRYGANSQIQISTMTGNLQPIISDPAGGNPTMVNGTDVQGTINGVAAHGFGQTLTAATTDASAGLQIKVTGTSLGNLGNINYSQGFAYQLNQLTKGYLAENGLIANRTDGINSTMNKLDDKILRLQDRLDSLRQQYTKQFNALDKIMSQMNSTSSFLTQQLTALAKSSG